MNERKSVLRLKQKHSQNLDRPPADIDAQALLDEQSLQRGLMGALVALLVLNAIWVYSALLFDRFYPWGSIVQGFLIGRAVRHFGRGINWQFPLLAALMTIVAALTGSFAASLNLTAREFSTAALSLLGEVSWYTIETFITRDFGSVGCIYAVTGALLAVFFASRRLDWQQELALQKLAEGEQT